jgi:hypothetical protein
MPEIDEALRIILQTKFLGIGQNTETQELIAQYAYIQDRRFWR